MSTTTPDLSFKVLNLLSKERGVYGLRNGDHERYRRHCSNKIHRLRQVTNLTSGKGKVYKSPPALDESSVKDVRHLHLLLFTTERSLAHANTIKAQPASPANRKAQLSFVRRAVSTSSSLYEIAKSLAASSRMNQKTLGEITIYHLSLLAELSFLRAQWAETLTSLAARRSLLAILGENAQDSYDQALANEFIDAYDPWIRFSAYKLNRPESHDIEGVVADVDNEMKEDIIPGYGKLVEGLKGELKVEQAEEGRKKLRDIEFGGEKVELRNAEVVKVMLKVQDALKGLEGKGRGMTGWDKVLGVLGEAEAVARRLLDDHEASGSATSLQSTRTSQSLSLFHQYTIHLLLTHRIRRDLLLVETLASSSTSLPSDPTIFTILGRSKTEDAVKSLAATIKLYDAVLQSMGQLRGLAIVEEKEGVRRGAEGLEAYFQATRCYHLARLHCIHPQPSFSSAIQLLSRSSLLVRQAHASLYEDVDTPIQEEVIPLSETQLKDIGDRIEKLELAAKRALFAERVEKPVFFDTAFNYIDLPMDELLVLAGKKEKSTAPASVVEVVKKTLIGRERTRETTPAPLDEKKDEETQEGKPKGWLGGWFGRG
ncbi:signal recognition particle subunit SRP68, partial [Tremellales sp. Uapishka_1]